MPGNQFGFDLSFDSKFEFLYNDIKDRIEEYFSHYNLVGEDIVYIQVSFRLLDKLVYTDLFLEKEKLNSLSLTDKKFVTNLLTIPITTNENFLGNSLPVFF